MKRFYLTCIFNKIVFYIAPGPCFCITISIYLSVESIRPEHLQNIALRRDKMFPNRQPHAQPLRRRAHRLHPLGPRRRPHLDDLVGAAVGQGGPGRRRGVRFEVHGVAAKVLSGAAVSAVHPLTARPESPRRRADSLQAGFL